MWFLFSLLEYQEYRWPEARLFRPQSRPVHGVMDSILGRGHGHGTVASTAIVGCRSLGCVVSGRTPRRNWP